MKPGHDPYVEALIRVLVVEDNIDDSDLLVRQLQKISFAGSIKIIPDGAEAWNLLQANQACLDLVAIFLDLKLATLSGLKLLRKIKSCIGLRDIPVFVMTSSNDPRDMEECSQLGVRGYVPKPVSYLAFSKAVADLFHPPTTRNGAL